MADLLQQRISETVFTLEELFTRFLDQEVLRVFFFLHFSSKMARISGVTIRFLAMMNVELLCRKAIINYKSNNDNNHHSYNKILKSEWLSTALISALIGQFDRTVRVMPK